MNLLVIQTNVNADTCTSCGGDCCKTMPGMAHPSDFGASEAEMVEAITARLNTHKWSIDWWEGDPRLDVSDGYMERCYYLRPRTAEATVAVDPSWGGKCTFLTSTGCAIFDSRPAECRELTPRTSSGGHCNGKGKQFWAAEWAPFQHVLQEALQKSDLDESLSYANDTDDSTEDDDEEAAA